MYTILGLATGGIVVTFLVYNLTEVAWFLYFKYKTRQL